jgi:hypothetical protein
MNAPTEYVDEIDRRQDELPPSARISILTLALLVSGGIYLAAQINRPASLIIPATFVAAAAITLVVNVILLARIKQFAWSNFFMVGKWALLGYGVIAGILEFVFIFDHTPSRTLTLFTSMLIIFAINVALLLAFSVARYQPVPESRD